MKKVYLALMVMGAMAVSTTQASANGGEVHFIGSVTDTTCNVNPVVDGVQKDTIQLGTMQATGTGATIISFSLVPESAACLAKTSGTVGWQSSAFTPEGLGNSTGTATGAFIKLTAANAAATAISANNQNATFSNPDGIKSFGFTAQLAKSAGVTAATAGTVLATATYTVAYL